MTKSLILVAEDDPMVRAVTLAVLEREGLSVLAAGTGQEAIAVFRARADEISMVLLDWVLPDISGAAVVFTIREIQPNIRIVVTSGYAHKNVLPLAIRRQVQGFLAKPYLPAQLLRAVRRVLGESAKAAGASG